MFDSYSHPPAINNLKYEMVTSRSHWSCVIQYDEMATLEYLIQYHQEPLTKIFLVHHESSAVYSQNI